MRKVELLDAPSASNGGRAKQLLNGAARPQLSRSSPDCSCEPGSLYAGFIVRRSREPLPATWQCQCWWCIPRVGETLGGRTVQSDDPADQRFNGSAISNANHWFSQSPITRSDWRTDVAVFTARLERDGIR